jgi:hypothetical protein
MERSAQPDWVKWVSAHVIRRLPPPVIRTLCIIDLALAFIPIWAWFHYNRWSGKRVSLEQFVKIYPKGVRFVLKHMAHSGQGTGPFALDWFTGPVRRASLPERPDWHARGTCGTCRNCCTTHWLPEPERATCPYLEPSGFCGAYGGVWWDYLNCGRYPAEPAFTKYYDCQRFGAPVPTYSPAA